MQGFVPTQDEYSRRSSQKSQPVTISRPPVEEGDMCLPVASFPFWDVTVVFHSVMHSGWESVNNGQAKLCQSLKMHAAMTPVTVNPVLWAPSAGRGVQGLYILDVPTWLGLHSISWVTLFSRKETGRSVKAGPVALCNRVQRTLKTYASRKRAGI